MGAPYSLDLRERVVAAVASGVSCRAAAARFDVSVSTAIRWTRRMKEVGSPAARPMGGKRPFLLASQADWVLTRLKQKPDLTLNALLMELRARGVTVSYYGVWHFVSRAGLSLKKSLHASEQDRADVVRRRRRWQQHQDKLNPKRLVFIDETWVKTNMTRTHGRCPKGERLVAKVPHGHWKTLTFVAALRCDGIAAPLCARWSDQRGQLPGLCHAVFAADATAWRRRHHG
jgi:transposase